MVMDVYPDYLKVNPFGKKLRVVSVLRTEDGEFTGYEVEMPGEVIVENEEETRLPSEILGQ